MNKAILAGAIAAIASVLMTGCILPIPTSHVAAPSIHGRVIDAQTGAPVDLAGVVVEKHKEASVVTKRDGTFSTDQITRSKPYWVWWPFKSDVVKEIQVKIARPGYGKEKEKITWHPNTETAVYLSKPIALKPKANSEVVQQELQRALH